MRQKDVAPDPDLSALVGRTEGNLDGPLGKADTDAMKSQFSLTSIGFALALALGAVPAAAQVVQPFASGLRAPVKLFALPHGELLVSEAGSGPNTGRVSFVDRDGRRSTIIDG